MPLVLKEEYAMYQHLVQLILLEKGTYPSHPDMGVGLISRYRLRPSDRNSDVVADLSADIESQISTYLPSLKLVNINLAMDQYNKIYIRMDAKNAIYMISVDTEGNVETGEDAIKSLLASLKN
jgi:hypothetical protein